ncbi:MAG: hypothetical protein AAF270_06300 [Pseudomonadota bacterium]
MRYIIGLILGSAVGVLLALSLMLYNPFFDDNDAASPSDAALGFAIAGQGAVNVIRTSDGYPWLSQQPALIQRPAIEGTRSAVTVMLASANDNRTVAYVTRVRSLTPLGKPLFGEVIEESVWYVVVPGKGTFIAHTQDDLWGFARKLAVPLAQGDTWRGKLAFQTTIGPLARGGEAIGLSGDYARQRGSAKLYQTVREVSVDQGLTDSSATLYIDF